MLKKTVCALLALCVLSCCLLPASAAALRPTGEIRLKLNSDVAGCLYLNSNNFIEILSDNVILNPDRDAPVSVSDYAGTVYYCPLEAGRTYYVSYSLVAADGYVLPEKLSDGDVTIECGKGVTVYSVQITTKNVRNDEGVIETSKGLQIHASVVVDSNHFWERIFGFLYDIYLKIRAWSLY